jgi:hypothetical protein
MAFCNKPFYYRAFISIAPVLLARGHQTTKTMAASFYDQLWPALAATVIGGMVLTAIFFVLKEQIFSLPQVHGTWECEQITSETAYGPFKGMTVWYRIVLLQDNEKILGTGEKDRDTGSTGAHEYSGSNRTPIEITGRIQKSITRSDVIHIHWSEDGIKRRSTTFHELRWSGSKAQGRLFGKFSSTAGASKGTASWTRRS